jgi:hypothetical protein
MTFFIAYPATAPNKNPPPAEKTNTSTGNLKEMPPQVYLRDIHRIFR